MLSCFLAKETPAYDINYKEKNTSPQSVFVYKASLLTGEILCVSNRSQVAASNDNNTDMFTYDYTTTYCFRSYFRIICKYKIMRIKMTGEIIQ
jgi:hypothetical protein